MGQFIEPSHDCYVIMVTWFSIPAELNAVLIMFFVVALHPTILIVFNLEQPVNISSVSVTFVISQPLKSNELRALQFWNILYILVALLVLKLLKFNDVSFAQ